MARPLPIVRGIPEKCPPYPYRNEGSPPHLLALAKERREYARKWHSVGYSPLEIATAMNVTRNRVSQILQS